ncbi:MAG: prepilin-type N-terminal cleavage/methylation domain-containing protein [Phycisphaerales bacterium]
MRKQDAFTLIGLLVVIAVIAFHGHVSGIEETTGENVPAYWYTGVHTAL